jgi:lipoyl-dependent peroxiredoxin
MVMRQSSAQWHGDLSRGQGEMRLGSGAFSGPYSFHSRFENGAGTNPEELAAAAHAGCFSMALAHALSEAGHPPRQIHTRAEVHLETSGDGFSIPRIALHTEAEIPGIDEATFQEQARTAKENCPISKLFAGAEITLEARLTHS